jgi:uncharacterized protein with HEPN domain
MLDECRFVASLMEELPDKESFLRDPLRKRAVERSLEIIGEASKMVEPTFREKHPELPWREMAGMWDRLIHHYFGVNHHIVWDVAIHHLPDLGRQLEDLVEGGRGTAEDD